MQSDPGDSIPPATEADRLQWASVPWTPVADATSRPDTVIGWCKTAVPYLPPAQAASLQALNVWIPATTATAPEPSSIPSRRGTWVVYIHGGAWRDPLITADSFASAATNLLLRASQSSPPPAHPSTPKLAGLVSLDYRLSPHPSHLAPTANDPSRSAKHPDHIADVLTALSYLGRLGVLPPPALSDEERPWVLAGHSCGATLAFQACMSPARWGLRPLPLPFGNNNNSTQVEGGAAKPAAVVGFNGLYDLEGFINGRPPFAAPGSPYAGLCEAYREFTAGAFGEDEKVWRAVCPASAEGGWVGEWAPHNGGGGGMRRRKWAVLVASGEDTLVPPEQRQVMLERLREEGEDGKLVAVTVRNSHGEHDDVWREGGQMAEVLWEVVERLHEMVLPT